MFQLLEGTVRWSFVNSRCALLPGTEQTAMPVQYTQRVRSQGLS